MQIVTKRKQEWLYLHEKKIDFPVKSCHKGHKKSLYSEKMSLNHKDITIINLYAPPNGVPRYAKQILKTEKRKIQPYNNTRKLQ